MSEWISVKDRLPERFDPCIVWTVYGERGEAWFDGHKFYWVFFDGNRAFATHWMPLPEPPKGE